jgi:hypothetical protein
MLSAAAVVLVTAGLFAQAKPDFAGKWTMDAPAGGAMAGGGGRGGRGGGGGWGMSPTITQDATSVTVEYTQGQNPVKVTYKLDGSESHNQMMGRGGQAADQVSKASWDGDKLKIVTTTANGDRTQTISLAGGKLSIETAGMGRDGSPMTTTTTYSKGM